MSNSVKPVTAVHALSKGVYMWHCSVIISIFYVTTGHVFLLWYIGVRQTKDIRDNTKSRADRGDRPISPYIPEQTYSISLFSFPTLSRFPPPNLFCKYRDKDCRILFSEWFLYAGGRTGYPHRQRWLLPVDARASESHLKSRSGSHDGRPSVRWYSYPADVRTGLFLPLPQYLRWA